MENVEVREVSIYFATYGTNVTPIGYNGAFAVRFASHSVESWRDIPNKFGNGDTLSADCSNGKVTLNGVEKQGLGALGNDWEEFALKPGLNQIKCVHSDWAQNPEIKLKYREVYI